VRRVVLAAPFTSLRDEAARVVGGPLSHLLVENYDNRARLRELAGRKPPPRVAIFQGNNDAMIPFAIGESLAREFPGLVQFFPVAGADHMSVLTVGRGAMLDWMARD
jgi:pimeloyl-ACP methyl ester carboxylesterase